MLAPALALAVVSAAAPMKLAALGFTAVDVNEEQAAFYSDHFSERLAVGGVEVVSRKDMTPEQRDLLSCCPSKLAEALGVDGLISGEISKSEGAYTLKIKIISADGTGTLFKHTSQPLTGDRSVVGELDKVARSAVNNIGDPVPDELMQPPPAASLTGTHPVYKLIPSMLGAAALVIGAVFLFQAQTDYALLTGSQTLASPEAVRDGGKSSLTLGLSCAVIGVAALALGILWYVL
jgi:hypothetical protein